MADVRRAVREWVGNQSASPDAAYLVALSGGSDSLALAWALAQEAPGLGVRAGAVVVDHQLQEGSAAIAQEAATKASELGLAPVMIKTVEVGKSGGPEDAARNARYQALSESLRETGATGILLAHTRDDQAETVLLGLTRGSGPSGLKGMAPDQGSFHRPVLDMEAATLRQALIDAGISWWEDPHNADEAYKRVVVRKTVLPFLEDALGPGVATSLARTADLFRRDSDALDAMASQFFTQSVTVHQPHQASLELDLLVGQPTAISSRALRLLVTSVGGQPPTYAQMQQVMGLIENWRGQSAIDVSGASVERKEGHIFATIATGRHRKGSAS